MFEDRIRSIAARLEAVRQKHRTEDWFGAKKHRFRLNPPLSEEEVALFEQQHSISLPEDYRQFLLLAGNGGAGPYFGIEPLSRWDFWFEQADDWPDLLASPCPFSYEQVTSGAWKESLPREREDWTRGSIHICDQGCTFVARLIVTGPSRGRVFNLDVACCRPPQFPKDANFIDWYERWLDEALAGEPLPWFGFDNPDYPDPGSWARQRLPKTPE